MARRGGGGGDQLTVQCCVFLFFLCEEKPSDDHVHVSWQYWINGTRLLNGPIWWLSSPSKSPDAIAVNRCICRVFSQFEPTKKQKEFHFIYPRRKEEKRKGICARRKSARPAGAVVVRPSVLVIPSWHTFTYAQLRFCPFCCSLLFSLLLRLTPNLIKWLQSLCLLSIVDCT